jgi:hypothetical protein
MTYDYDVDPTLLPLVEKCDYETKLAVTAWVMKHILDHANDSGSFRHLIYNRLGFNTDAYAPLLVAGGLEISNEFDNERIHSIKEAVRNNKVESLKAILNMCDEPDCFADACCGTKVGDKYRCTCSNHQPKKDGQ